MCVWCGHITPSKSMLQLPSSIEDSHFHTVWGNIFPNEVYSIARGRRSREAKYNDQNLSDIQSCSLSLSTMMLCDDFRLG